MPTELIIILAFCVVLLMFCRRTDTRPFNDCGRKVTSYSNAFSVLKRTVKCFLLIRAVIGATDRDA